MRLDLAAEAFSSSTMASSMWSRPAVSRRTGFRPVARRFFERGARFDGFCPWLP